MPDERRYRDWSEPVDKVSGESSAIVGCGCGTHWTPVGAVMERAAQVSAFKSSAQVPAQRVVKAAISGKREPGCAVIGVGVGLSTVVERVAA